MRIEQVVCNLDDDPDGNVQHIAEHGIPIEEVEDVLYSAEGGHCQQFLRPTDHFG